jgi:aryl-alcohol dehydrogenase-like predicted oxidoreductase
MDNNFNFNRRNFLRALSLGTAHILFSNQIEAGNILFKNSNPLQKVKLGKSGLKPTLIGFGTGVHAGNRTSYLTKQDRQKSISLLRHGYERGIRFFDCADSYGTHDLVAEALSKADREKVIISTKIWVLKGGMPESERPDADILIDRFRKELKTDYLDLVQIHCMTDRNWTETQKKQMDILEELKQKGIIKAHGVSVHSLDAMKAAAETKWTDVVHVRINPYGIAMDKPDPQEVISVINQLHKAGKGVVGMKLVGNGKLRNEPDKIQNALRFVLGLGSVNMMIIGFEEKEQIDNYLAMAENTLSQM